MAVTDLIPYTDESDYVGGWKDYAHHGQGSLTDLDGRSWVGEWKDGNQHGQGIGVLLPGMMLEQVMSATSRTANGMVRVLSPFLMEQSMLGKWKDDDLLNGTEYDEDGNVTAT